MTKLLQTSWPAEWLSFRNYKKKWANDDSVILLKFVVFMILNIDSVYAVKFNQAKYFSRTDSTHNIK